MNKKKVIFGLIVALLAVLIVWTAWGNTVLEINEYVVTSEKLPEAFNGYRIAHVSDLHNAEMGEENKNLLVMLKDAKPDIIAITGDIIDSRYTEIGVALRFAEEAAKISPCYYVTGNHEARVYEYPTLKAGLTELGVVILEDNRVKLEQSVETITLLGVDDPSFQTDYLFGNAATVMKSKLQELTSEKDTYTVLLSHRPELFESYAESGVDLVLSGHAHGGQFRLPLVGGLVAPNQGLFPDYDAGRYTKGNTNMLVSRGIGNSIFPFRFNNRPEVILIELKRSSFLSMN